jgi:hypothetical protein
MIRESLILSVALLAASAATAAATTQESLPPRSEWHTTSSSVEAPAIASRFAIDGDETTRWGGAFSAGHWLQVDLGREANVGGARLHWDSAFAAGYAIDASRNGSTWQTVYRTEDATGDVDYVFFAATRARYLRLASLPRTADWGVSLFEFEPIAAADVPRVGGLVDTASPWTTGASHALTHAGPAYELRVDFPRAIATAGLDVEWAAARRSAVLEARCADGTWQLLARDPQPLGDSSYLAARAPVDASALRLRVAAAPGATPSLRRIRLLGPKRVLTPMKQYEIAAAHAHRDLFPASLHGEQVYWTAVGIPAGVQKSIFDEYGDIEAFKGSPLVQPLWRARDGRSAAAYGKPLQHSLREGWMPLPAVEWSPQAGLVLRSEALAVEQGGAPVTLARYRLRNDGKSRIAGRLALLVRPMQMNPPWQNGGVSPVRDAAIDRDGDSAGVRINGRTLLESLTPVSASGASPFGAYGAGEITRFAAAGTVPAQAQAHDDDGLAAAMLAYDIDLEPGAQRDVVVAFALGGERIDVRAEHLPAAPSIERAALLAGADAGAAFDALATRSADGWRARLGKVEFQLPDRTLVDLLRAQGAYMLVNQTGHALQAGPRNYDRSFIRDGSATAAALLRLGDARTARDYLAWYAAHAVHENGLVSPILNEDGSVNRGFGSDIEYDSQGEFVYLVAEIARLDGGAQGVREYAPQVKLALQFLQQLRERTLVPGYLADREAPERFRGIIAPSISHEGYSTPTHSYWDDYWALKGWHDGAWLAREWGDAETARWAQAQYAALRESMQASVRATMAWKHSDIIPASADAGDGDPAGVSIALDPCGQQDLLPAEALDRTFTRYLDEVRQREKPGSLYAYTPYELRNVLSYVHLDRPRDADELLRDLLAGRRPREWQVFAEVVHSRLRHPGYLGDMPHTWIGSEYVRTIIGMLLHEADDALELLPGAPPQWLAGDGLRVGGLPTAYGKLTFAARDFGGALHVTLDPGVRNSAVVVRWPSRRKPAHVSVDGAAQMQFDADGIRLAAPFRELIAQW